MFKNLASICAALVIAAAAFSTPAQAQRHHGGVNLGGAGLASHGYAYPGGYGGHYYRGGYAGHYYRGGWGYYGGGLAAGAILGGLLAAAPYYGSGYYDGYGYGDYGYAYAAPVYVEPAPGYYYYYGAGVNCLASPGSPNFGACN